ncbi:MAG: hypothetical protein ACU4EQ_04390 [Candidatus Nitrosoglobus sp.]|jgi:hypothetical protein
MLSILNATQTSHGPLLSSRKFVPRIGVNVPCKNVDLQTGSRWACSSGFFGSSPDSGYRAISFEDDKNLMKALQQAILPGIPPPGWNSEGKSGWFFSMPDAPHPPPDYDSRRMMKTEAIPFGSVINLNPCCFGEIYWVGGIVGSDYVVFAVWIPYSHWVTGPLPILFHFRPAYDDDKYPMYRRARAAAVEQRAPAVFGALALPEDFSALHQPFLDSAWYYLLGQMAFVQQMLATRRLAILVLMIPPTSGGPDAFFTGFDELIVEAVDKALQKAAEVGSGSVSISKDGLILTANSFGGTYLMRASRNLKKGRLRELWMFDCTNMVEGWGVADVVKRLYIAQQGNRGSFFSGRGSPFDREDDQRSIIDVSHVPAHGDSLHNFCGRLCFSHACSLSTLMTPLQADPLLDRTLYTADCDKDQEFWKKR